MKNLIKIVFTVIVFSLNTLQAQWYQIGQLEGQEMSSRAGWSVSINSDGSVVAYGEVTNSNNGAGAGQVKIYMKKPIATGIKLDNHSKACIPKVILEML